MPALLHTHSCYSFLEGLIPPQQLARAAQEAGYTALALTDHLWLTGAVPFTLACREVGIRPLLGLEIDLLLPYRLAGPAQTGSLVLLAQDEHGWRSLCRLSSLLFALERPTCTLEHLAGCADGLVCLAGAEREAQREALPGLKRLFPARLYVEVGFQPSRTPQEVEFLRGLSASLGLPLAASHSVYTLLPAQAALQRTVSAVRNNLPISRLSEGQCAPPGSWLVGADEFLAGFANLPEALEGMDAAAARCTLELSLHQPHYPSIALPGGASADQVLRSKAEAGAKRLYGEISPAVRQRLERELEVIAHKGFAPVFLIAEETLAFARQAGIVTSSRGSAASSLVAHCLGITTPDPLEHDLYFERFLNPARSTPPDIDTDVCSRRRDELLRHVFETYGFERTAMVGVISTYRPRSALQDAAKAHGLKPAEVRALSAALPHFYGRPLPGDEPEDPQWGPFSALAAQHPRYAPIFRDALALLSLPRHLSVHPGGVVIAPGPMTDFLPLAAPDSKGLPVIQFELKAVEEMGMIKLDLLGVRGLTVLGDVTRSIHSWRRKEFRSPLDVLDKITEDDAETGALIMATRTVGCFSIESPGMRATLKEIHAHSPADLLAALALYRPGPMKGGLRDSFVRRHNRQEQVTPLHPALADLLQETYGVILYQEQVLRIANQFAGFSLPEADLLRRAMSHFDPGKQMQALKDKFIAGSARLHQADPEQAASIWEMMAAFAGYGFPKAHAASYARVAWCSAWCKAHYPAEFIAAVLANQGGYYPQSVYLNEARRMKLGVKPPHINHSRAQFSVSYPDGDPLLYMGLDQVRDLTARTLERVLLYRPYHSLDEFLAKVDPRHEEAEHLIQVGALEGLGAIPDLLQQLAPHRVGQLSLFGEEPLSLEDWSQEQKVQAQHDLLGIALEAHPLDLYAPKIAAAKAVNTLEAAAQVGKEVRVVGMRQMLRRSRTAQGAWMAFLSLEDLEGMLDVVIFPDVYARSKSALSAANIPILVEGTLEIDANTAEPVLRAAKIVRI